MEQEGVLLDITMLARDQVKIKTAIRNKVWTKLSILNQKNIPSKLSSFVDFIRRGCGFKKIYTQTFCQISDTSGRRISAVYGHGISSLTADIKHGIQCNHAESY